MAKKRKKAELLSDQLRAILLHGPMSRYAISQASGVDQGQLHRFVTGKGRLTTDSLDRIGQVLRLRFVQDDE